MSSNGIRIEVVQRWGEVMVDTKHFDVDSEIALSSETGWLWTLAGRRMGFVPRGLAPVLAMSPPLLSAWDPQVRGNFSVADTDHPDGRRTVCRRDGSGGVCVVVPTRWNPEVLVDGKPEEVENLLLWGRARRRGDEVEIDLDHGVEVAFDTGSEGFLVRPVSAGAPLPRALPSRSDQVLGGIFANGLFMVAMFGAWVGVQSPPITMLEEIELPVVHLTLQAEPEPEPEPPPVVAKSRDKPAVDGLQRSVAPEPSGEPGPGADRAVGQASAASLLGGLDAMMAGMGVGSTLEAAVSRLSVLGTKMPGMGNGLPGGRRMGGGGDVLGLGSLGPSGTGSGPNHGGDGFGDKGVGDPGVTARDPIMTPGLARSVVGEVVQRHLSQIRYCYQRELQSDPSLMGAVTISFTIAGDGSVARAKTAKSTLGDAAVERCIADRFLQMTFPAPQGSGIVMVRYPFVFSPG